jgi:RimJ/RimL family protein N-acetyltransferase
LVDYGFESLGITRAFGMLHPDNIASAMVLERTGFLFEGHTRLSYWLGDDNSDDWIYGLTRSDWEAWRNRPRHAPDRLRLVEITPENQRKVARLQTHRSQQAFVATVTESYGDALFPEIYKGEPMIPWMRAIEADGELAGFVMLGLPTASEPETYLWRLLIDRRHQRRGIGARALDLVVDECRRRGDRSLMTSWVPGKGSPEPFYRRYGFEPTGDIEDGEVVARLSFDRED